LRRTPNGASVCRASSVALSTSSENVFSAIGAWKLRLLRHALRPCRRRLSASSRCALPRARHRFHSSRASSVRWGGAGRISGREQPKGFNSRPTP
jgi:hypothetical protein